jgi:hypothetical protein
MTMQTRLLSSTLLCTLALLGPSAVASAALDVRAAQARWLSGRLHRTVEASEVLVSPEADALEGCTIIHARAVPLGATALSLRCPAHALPQLVLLKLSLDADFGALTTAPAQPLQASPKVRPIVRAGAALQADWRTGSLHAELPVVALDSGASGAEIRVRVAGSNRVMRARILTAHSVTIVAAGA